MLEADEDFAVPVSAPESSSQDEEDDEYKEAEEEAVDAHGSENTPPLSPFLFVLQAPVFVPFPARALLLVETAVDAADAVI